MLGSDKALDKLSNGLDKVTFTPQEKAKHWIDVLAQYEAFKITQRFLALMVAGSYLFVFVVMAVPLYVYGMLTPDSVYLEMSKGLANMNREVLGISFGVIVTFYFGGGLIESITRNRRDGK
jgi:hypothetical protein